MQIFKHGLYFSQETNGATTKREAEQIENAFKFLLQQQQRIVIFALNTGLRKSDILPPHWEDIKYADNIIHLYIRKTNKYANMPCTQMLLDFIEKTPKENRHGAIFINPLTKRPPKEIKRAWNIAKQKANIENLRFHDL